MSETEANVDNVSLYIVIVTYNARKWLDFVLPPLCDLPSSWRVLIVDNASTDDTVSYIKSHFPGMTVIENHENLGFGRANNIGLSQALQDGVEHIFLLNQDARVTVQTLEKLLRIQRKHPEYLVVSPVHLNGDGDEVDLPFSNGCMPRVCPGMLLDALQGHLQDVYPSTRANAAAWMLSRETLQRVGGFNPLYYHYGEDDDYINRVFFHGYKVGITPYAFILHGREQKASTRPTDYLFIRRLTKFIHPSREAGRVLSLSFLFIPVIVRNFFKKRYLVSRHFWSVYRQMARDILSGRAMNTQTRQEGPKFL